MSDSNNALVRAVVEVTTGVTPTAATWDLWRITGESLTGTAVKTQSSEIRSDRLRNPEKDVNKSISGSIDIEFSADSFDTYIEAAMGGTWTADVLKTGLVKRSFSIEKEFTDIAKFVLFKGMRVGQWSLSMAFGSIVTGSFTFAGTDVVVSGTSAVGAGSTNAATTTEVLNASTDISNVKIDGVATNVCIQSLTLDVNANLREQTCIGKAAPTDQNTGSSSISGTMEVYASAESFDLYGVSLSNSTVEIEYTVTDGVNSYTFLIPNARLSGDTPMIGGLDTDVMHTITFNAYADETEGTDLKITRV